MKARLAAGETLFGTFLTLGSPLAAESLGLAGFDWLLVDLEHGGGDESLLLGQLMGCSSAGVHALVRVESDVRGRTARALDLGVEGVMCPQVNSAEAGGGVGERAALRPDRHPRDRAVSPRRALRHRPGRDRARARRGRSGSRRSSRPRRSRPSRRSRRSTGSTCCSSARATCRTRWAASAQFDDPEFRSAIERVVEPPRATPGKAAGIFLRLAGRGAGGGRRRLPDDRHRLRRRLHDAGRPADAGLAARAARDGLSAARIASAHRSPSGHSSSRTSGERLAVVLADPLGLVA